MTVNCVFCKIKNKKIPAEILFEDAYCFIIKDINPVAPIHFLIIPNIHFTYLDNLTDDFAPVIFKMFEAAKNIALHENVLESGYRLVINQKDDAGQEIPHLHLHLIAGIKLKPLG